MYHNSTATYVGTCFAVSSVWRQRKALYSEPLNWCKTYVPILSSAWFGDLRSSSTTQYYLCISVLPQRSCVCRFCALSPYSCSLDGFGPYQDRSLYFFFLSYSLMFLFSSSSWHFTFYIYLLSFFFLLFFFLLWSLSLQSMVQGSEMFSSPIAWAMYYNSTETSLNLREYQEYRIPTNFFNMQIVGCDGSRDRKWPHVY